METIVLKNGDLRATFLKDLGLNLISFKKNDLEVIAQNTKKKFEDRFSGLGPLIGPHFYHQKDDLIVHDFDHQLFPHIERIKKRGQKDYFSHGIGRYVPWNAAFTETRIHATLTSHDTFQGTPLSKLEGYDFAMTFDAELLENGLQIEMSVSSDRECLSGIHYYFDLPEKKGTLIAPVKSEMNDGGKFRPIPEKWLDGDDNLLKLHLNDELDYGFLPIFEDYSGWAHLKTKSHELKVTYVGEPEKISFQVYSPKNASFVCIEPMSAKNPRGLDQTSSKFNALIEIYEKEN